MDYIPVSKGNKRLIIDTDICNDCDDAGALAVAGRLKQKYGYDLAGIVNCTASRFANSAIDAICEYYGCFCEKTGYLEEDDLINRDIYGQYLAENMQNKASERIPATKYYEDILSESDDNSVVIVTLGPFRTVSNLLKSHYALFGQKVYAVVSMACEFPGGREYNAFYDAKSTKYFMENCPCPIIACGFEIGNRIICGFKQIGDSPAAMAYKLHNDAGCSQNLMRESWDLLTVLYAVEGGDDFFTLSDEGRIVIGSDGSNSFIPENGANRWYMILKCEPQIVENYVNDLLG